MTIETLIAAFIFSASVGVRKSDYRHIEGARRDLFNHLMLLTEGNLC